MRDEDDYQRLGLSRTQVEFCDSGFCIPLGTVQTIKDKETEKEIDIVIGGKHLTGSTVYRKCGSSQSLGHLLRVTIPAHDGTNSLRRVLVQKTTHGEEAWYLAAMEVVVDMNKKNVRKELRDAGTDVAKLKAAISKAETAGIPTCDEALEAAIEQKTRLEKKNK